MTSPKSDGVRCEFSDEFDEWLYTLSNEDIDKDRKPGLWMFAEGKGKTIYFTCPYSRCAKVNMVDQDDCYDAGTAYSADFEYYCFYCIHCRRHLWLHFEDLSWHS